MTDSLIGWPRCRWTKTELFKTFCMGALTGFVLLLIVKSFVPGGI